MRQQLLAAGKGLGRLGLGYAALVGVLLTAPLIGVLYFLDHLAGLPFVPYALFDWIGRVLPGPLVTFGIDLLIDGLNLLGFSVANTAKTAEQLGAILLFFTIAVVVSVAFFAVLRARSWEPQLTAGLVLGVLLGLPSVAVSLPMGQSDRHPLIVIFSLSIVFLLWGLAFVPAHRRALGRPAANPPEAEEAGEEVRSAQTINRRQFLIRLGGATATITVLSGGLGMWLAQREEQQLEAAMAQAMDQPGPDGSFPFPNANDPVSPAPGTRMEYTPVADHYKVFIRTEPTVIDIATWTLPITGLVNAPRSFTIDEIRNNYQPRDQFVTLSCISGRIGTDLISTTRWTGVSLQEILADVGLQSEARYLVISSGDGFHETVALDLINSDERIMLAYAWDGQPIPFDHGFPLRIWLPDRYGMKQPKWITGIEVVADYQEGYWVERGWDEVARVNATSVIDTVAVNSLIESNGQQLVPVGGIAFAGARGISRVEVRVDDGPWQPAQLRSPLSETTWVIWRYEWPFQAGDHTFEVRCAEADGTPQSEESRDSRPSGATGVHQRRASL